MKLSSDELAPVVERPQPQIRLAFVAEPPLPAVQDMVDDTPDAAEAILIIEDEPEVVAASSSPGVRRENYRNLFTRLRHGA